MLKFFHIIILVILVFYANGCKDKPELNKPDVQFGLISDVQYAEKPEAIGKHYALSLHALSNCVMELNQKDLDFTIQLGDIIDGGQNAEKELKAINMVYNQLRMPHYHVLGGHDFEGLDRQITMALLGLNRGYYSFDIKQWHFIILNTYAAISLNASESGGGLDEEQLLWLNQELSQAQNQNKSVIVFGHLPLIEKTGRYTVWNAAKVIKVFEKYSCVKAYFSGHLHDNWGVLQNDIHYIVVEAMVDYADKGGAWAVVKLYDNKIVIDGIGGVKGHSLAIKRKGRYADN
jgi:predicted phosphodiesterase